MNEQEAIEQEAIEQEAQMLAIREFWLDQLGLEIGAGVVILPIGGQAGAGFQGILVDFILNAGNGMIIAVIIQQAAGLPRVVIRWEAIAMITKGVATAPVDKTNVPDEVDFDSLVAFAKNQGIEVPDDIQAMLDTPGL